MNDTCICDNVPKVWRLTGVTRTLRLRIFNPDGTPLDLTGRTVGVTIARDNSEFVYAPGFVIEGDDNNVVKFEWPADQQGAGDYTINVTTTDGSGNVDRVNWHGPTGIRLVDFSFMVRGEDALGVTSEANIGLDGTFTMNGAGMSAYDEWLAEGHTGTPEDFIVWLRQPAEDAATEAEATVDAKMAEVDADMAAIEATAAADHTRAENDHTTATGDHTRAEADHAQAITDSQQAATDHQRAEIDALAAAQDREKAETDRTKAAYDRAQAAADHDTAAADHATAASDHQQAQSDHSTASADHTQAVQDAEQAASDHTRAGDDHDTAVADHQRTETDHTRAEQDHTTAAADHTTAAADHTQATADHAVMAGYDTRLGNVEDEVSQLGQEVDDLPNIKGLQNLWQMTSHGTFINAQGAWSSDGNYDACQLEMIPGATYWVYPPLRTASGASQPATRVFRKVGTTYTQVWYQIQGGGKVSYTCPSDGNTYIIQLASPKKLGFSDVVGTPRIYLMNKQPKAISDIEGKLFLPNLWEVTFYHGYIDGTGTATYNSTYNSCQLYDVIPGHTYAVRMQLVGSGVGNYMRIYSVASNGALTNVFNKQQNGGIISYIIPDDGSAYMMQVATRVSPDYPNDGPAPEIYDITENIPYRMGRYNKLRVLFIANSHARDAFSYMPAILESIVPGIDITLGILYKGGCTLAEHYSYISNGTAYEAFDKYATSYGKWVTTTDSSMTTCDAALANEKWDIIVLQQRSILSGDYSTYQPYANDIVALLFGKVGHAVQIGFNMTYALADNYSQQPDESSNAQYINIANATQLLLKDTPFQFVIPTATAIQNARQTTLKSLGTFGDMTYDGLHIQEGIPCITAAYCACLKFLDIMGERKFGVLGSIFRPSDNWVTSEGVPQKHGSCVGVTNENNFLLAQRCAMAANLFPFEITPPIQ